MEPIEKIDFVKPTSAADFKAGENRIDHTDARGAKVAYVLLRDGSIAEVREGKGSDVERATMESNGNQQKYLTALMASATSIDGTDTNMYALGELHLKDYMSIQLAFADLNF